MRVCLLTHQFLPDNKAGVEVYVHRCARALLAQGHDVMVFATRKDLTRREGEVVEEEFEGVPVQRLIRNLFHDGFGRTFADDVPEAAFQRAVLDDFRPDVVHVHHLIHHSMGVPALAKARGIPVAMTLHDYWLECPRMGRLLAWDANICEVVDLERCSRCLQTFSWRNPPRLAVVARSLHGLRRATGFDVQKPLQRIFRTLGGKRSKDGDPPPDAALVKTLEERRRVVRGRLVPAVDRFLCPSRFLLQRIAAFGVPAERLFHNPYGTPRPPAGWSRHPRQGPRRLAFCGSVLPHKGVHVLLAAFRLLRARYDDSRVTLAVHGGWESDPGYGERMKALGGELGVRVTGSYDPPQIDHLLADVDALVVPSLWYENQPITILDARVRGIPAIVSDCGGMAELVRDAELRFRTGDAADLCRALAAFVERPERAEESLPPTPEEDMQRTLKHYAALVR